MKENLMIVAIAVAGAAIAMADGGGMGGGMMGGSGMLAIADDNSVLVTEMGMGGTMGGPGELERELINIDPGGQERWRVAFDEGWPMMPATDGDLVVLTLAADWWMGDGGMGDGGWNHGGMGGAKTLDHGDDSATSTLVGLDLSTGQERWRLELAGNMISMPRFTEDGSRLYLTVRDMGEGHVPGGPMRQGDASGPGMLTTSKLVAVDRDGSILWTIDLDDGHMGGPMSGGGS